MAPVERSRSGGEIPFARSPIRPPHRPPGIVRHRKLLGLVSVVLLAWSAALFYQDGGESQPNVQQPANPERILMQSSDRPGDDTFTSSVAQASVTSRLPSSIPDAGTPGRFSGSSDGFYAATRGTSGCDASELGTLLKASPGKARSWAAAARVAAADITPYINSLTPAFTRADIRVTDYGLVGDRPVGRQAVMGAGTAVLLDRTGVPRVRCISGNPLGPPRTVPSNAGYIGSGWAGFRPDAAIVVQPASEPLSAFILFDVATGQNFARIPGSVALIDVDKPQAPTVLKVLQPGQRSTVSGTLWPRTAPLTITFDNPEDPLAEADADSSGDFSVEVTIPEDAEPGMHELTIAGGGFRVDQTVYVIPPSVRGGPA
jgi:hypothetical protein